NTGRCSDPGLSGDVGIVAFARPGGGISRTDRRQRSQPEMVTGNAGRCHRGRRRSVFRAGRRRPDVLEGQPMTYETILVEREARVGIITLNRPQALNALNSQVMNEVTSAATELDSDPGIGAIIITGSPKAFAAGADIKEMAGLSFADAFGADFFAPWSKLAAMRTPTIAAVAGYALGGGCEL